MSCGVCGRLLFFYKVIIIIIWNGTIWCIWLFSLQLFLTYFFASPLLHLPTIFFSLSPLQFLQHHWHFYHLFFFYLLSHFRSQAGNKLGSNCGSGDAKFTVSLLSPIFFPKKFGNPITKFWLSPHSANKLRPMHVSLVNFHLCNIYPKYSNWSDTQHKKSSIVKIMLYAVFYAHYIIVTWKCDFKLRF